MKATSLAIAALIVLFTTACQSPDKESTGTQATKATVPEDNGDFIQKISPDNGVTFKHYIGDHHMDNLVEQFCPVGINCRKIILTGIPYRELLQAIENEKPYLMIVGVKGRSNLSDALVGSTARKLYRRSPIPLLTIPAGFDELP